MTDYTHADAKADAEREKYESDQEAWKAKIIASPIELSQMLNVTGNELYINILRNMIHLAGYGIELRNYKDQTAELPKQVVKQTIDEAIELSDHLKQAIEEYVK